MPELPEVQTIVDDLNAAGIIGTTIIKARVYWPPSVANLSPGVFCRQMAGREISGIRRRGKWIEFAMVDDGCLLVHLRMTGRFHLTPADEKRAKHQHVILHLNNDLQLRYQDTRKFGRFYLVDTAEVILGTLGPEPLEKEFTARTLSRKLLGKNRILKPLLLDQTFIAGLGNIYVDEALWDAAIHPLRKSPSLSKSEIRALHRAIRKVLRRGIENLGTTLGSGQTNFYSIGRRRGRNRDRLRVFRKTGAPCLRCRTPIQRIIVGQRSTHICPTCQPIEVEKKSVK